MSKYTLVRRSLTYHWRTNLAVMLGVAVAVAVLAGALLVGASVRASLADLVLQRLGHTDLLLTGELFFREQLAADIAGHPRFQDTFTADCPLIAVEGLVTHQESGRRAGGVRVYGVDQRFWAFHGLPPPSAEGGDRALWLSPGLQEELQSKPADTLLVRIEKPSAIPAGSLHGRKEDRGVTLRFAGRGALAADSLGEFSLKPQQSAVRAVFVSLQRLQRELGQTGKVNAILAALRKDTDAAPRNPENLAATQGETALKGIVTEAFSLEDLGLRLHQRDSCRCVTLESDAMLLPDKTAETARTVATQQGLRSSAVLTYLANSIRNGGRDVPYSLASALDAEAIAALPLTTADGRGQAQRPAPTPAARVRSSEETGTPALLLNEWAAKDLGARLGDTITLEYYVWQDEGLLDSRTAAFRLAGVVPMEGPALDRHLAPDFPGITESHSLKNWDPPFPMDLARIRPSDEDYWNTYNTAPKAFIQLESGQSLWGSRYGRLTSLRLFPRAGREPEETLRSYAVALKAAMHPFDAGLAAFPVRAEGLAASRGTTDFGEYFLYFSFFLMASALLLTGLFFKLGVEQRSREIGTLKALGFDSAALHRLFLAEGLVLAVSGSLLGCGLAWAYGEFMLLGLRTWWVGAVGTTRLVLHPSWTLLGVGAGSGVLAAVLCAAWTLRGLRPVSARRLLTGARDAESSGGIRTGNRAGIVSAGLILVGVGLLGAAAAGWVGQTPGFFAAGMVLLTGALAGQSAWLRRNPRRPLQRRGWLALAGLGVRNVSFRSGRSVLCIALIASATFIIVSVDAFRHRSTAAQLDRRSGSGGFPLVAESLLPLLHDPNTAAGRTALNLPGARDFDGNLAIARFRVRPGDDASCLNLYQPRTPRVLGATPNFVRSGRFGFQSSAAATAEERANPWLLLENDLPDGAVPVIADANSLAYSLHLKLGQEWTLDTGTVSPVRVRVVGALADSLFQGELIMAEKHFLRLFPEYGGFRFFLIDTPAEKAAALSALLEDRLSDYGFDASPTEERLAMFHRVENTYISTFQSLGSLGLVLGTLGLAVVLLRNVLERRRELALQRAVGFNSGHLAVTVLAENTFLLCSGLMTGTLCALAAVAPVFLNQTGRLSLGSVGVILLAVLVTGLVASVVATAAALRSPLLSALRSE